MGNSLIVATKTVARTLVVPCPSGEIFANRSCRTLTDRSVARKHSTNSYCYGFEDDGPHANTVLGAVWMMHKAGCKGWYTSHNQNLCKERLVGDRPSLKTVQTPLDCLPELERPLQ